MIVIALNCNIFLQILYNISMKSRLKYTWLGYSLITTNTIDPMNSVTKRQIIPHVDTTVSLFFYAKFVHHLFETR